jgi:predicted O-methyltransferase YrrM
VDIKGVNMRPSANIFKEKHGNKKVKVLEVGVMRGVNSQDLLNGLNCEFLFLLDRFHEHYQNYHVPKMLDNAMEVFKKFDNNDKVVIIRHCSLKFPLFSDEYLDYIYLDGNHSYEHVIREIPKYWKVLKTGGMISGDNFEMPGVQNAVMDFCRENDFNYDIKSWKMASDGKTKVYDWWVWKNG